MNDSEKRLITECLAELALADHLGDVRDAERWLYRSLGVETAQVEQSRDLTDHPLEVLKAVSKLYKLPLPPYVK